MIPCRNEARTITRVLDALEAQTRLPDEVVIVDDHSIDATQQLTRDWAAAHPQIPVRIVAGAGRGAGASMNAGVRATLADVIIRLDGHCEPSPEYVAASVETLATPGAGVAGGVWKIQPGDDTMAARGIASVLSHPLGSGGADYRRPPGTHRPSPIGVDTVPFGSFRRDLWERIGGFDEHLIRNQDYDFNYRIRLLGLEIVLNPAIVSVYKARPTLGSLWRQYFDYGYWKVAMLRKFPESIRVRQALPLALSPALVLLAALASAGYTVALVALMAYVATNAAGAVQASLRTGDLRIAPYAFVALVTLQNAWSAGAWLSVVQGRK